MTGDKKIVARACMEALREMWDREIVRGDPTGGRIFVRYVDTDELAPGWNDWKLEGVYQSGGWWDWINGEPTFGRDILRDIKVGEREGWPVTDGKIQLGTLSVYWCRSRGDGPPGPRVSDWAGRK